MHHPSLQISLNYRGPNAASRSELWLPKDRPEATGFNLTIQEPDLSICAAMPLALAWKILRAWPSGKVFPVAEFPTPSGMA